METALHVLVRAHHLNPIFPSKFRHFLGVTRLGDDQLRLGRPRLLLDLRRGVKRVGRGGRGAGVRGAEEGKDEFGRVVEEEHDDVALVDTDLVEAGGDSSGGEFDVGVGVGFAGGAVDDAGFGAELGYFFEAVGVEW